MCGREQGHRRSCSPLPPPAKSTRSHTRAKAIIADTSTSPVTSSSLGKRTNRVEKPRQPRAQTAQGTARKPPPRQGLGKTTSSAKENNAKATTSLVEVNDETPLRRTTRETEIRRSSRLQTCSDLTDPFVTATVTAYPVDGDKDTDHEADAALGNRDLDWSPPSGRVYCVEHFLEEAHEFFIKHCGSQSIHSRSQDILELESLLRSPSRGNDRDRSKLVTSGKESEYSSTAATHGYDTRQTRTRHTAKSHNNATAPYESEMEFGLGPRDRVARLREQIELSLGELRIRDGVLRRWAREGRPASTHLNAVVNAVENTKEGSCLDAESMQTPQWQAWATPCVFRLCGNPLQCYYCPLSPGGMSGHELFARRYATPRSRDASPQLSFPADLAKACGMPVGDAGGWTVDESIAWLKEYGTVVKESGPTKFIVDNCGLEPKIVLVEMGREINKP